MKKPGLLGVAVGVFTILLAGCSKEIDHAQVIVRNGLMYKYGDDDPFTGTIKNDPKTIFLGVQSASCNSSVRNGRYDGERICYIGKVKVAELHYDQGLESGTEKKWNPVSGNKTIICEYKADKMDGLCEAFSPISGKNVFSSNYAGGKLNGSQKEWGEMWKITEAYLKDFVAPDEVITDLVWSNDLKSGSTITMKPIAPPNGNPGEQGYTPGSAIIAEEYWKDGLYDGKCKYYLVDQKEPMNRVLYREEEFSNGLPVGLHREYIDDKIAVEMEFSKSGEPLRGLVRHFDNGAVINEVKLVSIDTKKGKTLAKDGEEKRVFRDKLNGNRTETVTQWNKSYKKHETISKYENNVLVSYQEYSPPETVMFDPSNSYVPSIAEDVVLDHVNSHDSQDIDRDGIGRVYKPDGTLKEETVYNHSRIVSQTVTPE